MTDLFAALDRAPEPPLPPGFIEQTLRLARRGRLRRRITAAMMAILLGALGFLLPGQLATGGLAPAGSVILPDRVAGYNILTASAEESPPGAALLLFASGNWEQFTTVQDLVLATDGFTYRHVKSLRGDYFGRGGLLSPDGKAVLIAEDMRPTAAFLHVDLVTGRVREIPLPIPTGVILHAWSPDGRFVAYAQAPWSGMERSNAMELEVRAKGKLTILDLTSGQSRVIPQVAVASAAAFAPGSDRLAVQVGAETTVIDLDGGNPRKLDVPAPYGIVPGVAWSPDGHFIALIPWHTNGTNAWQPKNGWWSRHDDYKVVLFDTGSGTAVPKPLAMQDILGWRSPESLVSFDFESSTLSEVPIDGGTPTLLTTFEARHNCEYGTQVCLIESVQAATGLLGSFAVQPARTPARGPLPLWLELIGAAAAIGLGGLGVWLLRFVRRAPS